ncbi:unnamed protein product, partial [Prorocentrum cordatum]
ALAEAHGAGARRDHRRSQEAPPPRRAAAWGPAAGSPAGRLPAAAFLGQPPDPRTTPVLLPAPTARGAPRHRWSTPPQRGSLSPAELRVVEGPSLRQLFSLVRETTFQMEAQARQQAEAAAKHLQDTLPAATATETARSAPSAWTRGVPGGPCRAGTSTTRTAS